MKKFLFISWIIAIILFSIFYLIASFSAFISPDLFSYTSIFALAFPYLFIIGALLCIAGFFIHKKSAYILLAILFCGSYNLVHTVSFHAPKAFTAAKDSTTLRIMTWNVQSFDSYLLKHKNKDGYKTNRSEMLQLILDYNPDVICFQEYLDYENTKKRRSIHNDLFAAGYPYAYASNEKFIESKRKFAAYGGTAIYSKYPLIDSGKLKLIDSDVGKQEYMIYASLIFNHQPVRVFTAHLASYYIYSDTTDQTENGGSIYQITYDRKLSVQSKIRETGLTHLREAKMIRQQIDASPYPVIYCGDMNSTACTYQYRYLKNDLQDAFLQKGSGIGVTFYKLLYTLRIDFCLVNKNMQVLQSVVGKEKLSDHYPVISDVKWSK
ncbi:MAG: endonuclease/exonuclease/phosphatase family protein [Bacteroidetes bacterium]|nr:endonuclease/exonuclease/phosphatase family protein [Bacteroidota bacterium]